MWSVCIILIYLFERMRKIIVINVSMYLFVKCFKWEIKPNLKHGKVFEWSPHLPGVTLSPACMSFWFIMLHAPLSLFKSFVILYLEKRARDKDFEVRWQNISLHKLETLTRLESKRTWGNRRESWPLDWTVYIGWSFGVWRPPLGM